jgi:hypothetical protein
MNRVYFQVYDPSKGTNVNVYYGKPGNKGFHGITVEEFLNRVDAKPQTGEAIDSNDAIRQVISEDSANAKDSPDGGEEAPYDFTNISMYIRSA